MHKFIEKIICFSLRHHIFVIFLTLVLLVSGIVCYMHTPVEAYPDVTNTRVKIIAQWNGRSEERRVGKECTSWCRTRRSPED